MPTDRLLRCTLFSEANNDWRVRRGGHSMTPPKDMKTWISGLDNVRPVRLPGWGSCETYKRRVGTVGIWLSVTVSGVMLEVFLYPYNCLVYYL